MSITAGQRAVHRQARVMPTDEQLLAAAEHAVARAGGEAQATAWWERRGGDDDATGIEVVVVRDAMAHEGAAAGLDDAAIAAALERLAADAPSSGLPAPGGHARMHEGFDPAALSAPAADADVAVDVRAAKVAIVSSRGVRAVERRTVARAEATGQRDGRRVSTAATASALGVLDLAALRAEADDLLGDAAPVAAPAGEPVVVLGPEAVAVVLDLLRPRFAAGGDRLPVGRRAAASAIALAESPRFAGTVPRSLDAEGLARHPVPLLQDGIAHRVVADSATAGAQGTGHATRPGRPAPRAEHLVLVGGGAASLGELLAPVADGLYVPALAHDGGRLRLRGAFAVEGGRRGAAVQDAFVELSPLDVLASAQALTMRQRAVPWGGPSARTASATVCPALRAGAGLRVT